MKEKLVNKYEDLFEKQIIYRGKEYYQNDMVRKVFKSESTYIAKVAGSYKNEYNVHIEIGQKGISMHCDCPYHDNCKHEYATLIAVDNKEYKSIKLLPVEESEEIRMSDLLKAIPEDKLKKYIADCFDIDDEMYKDDFIEEFEVYLPKKPREYFYNTLFNEFQLDSFRYNLSKFIKLAEKSLEHKKYHYAFLIGSSIIEAYKDSKYEDKQKVVFINYNTFATIIRIANRKGSKTLKAEIQKWIDCLKDKNYYDDIYLEDMIEMTK